LEVLGVRERVEEKEGRGVWVWGEPRDLEATPAMRWLIFFWRKAIFEYKHRSARS